MSGIVIVVLVFFGLAMALGGVAFFVYQGKLRRAKSIERGLKMVPLLIHLPPPSSDTTVGGRDVKDVMREKTAQAEVLYNLIAGTATAGFKSSFYGQRHIALELVATDGLVHFYAAVPVNLVSVVEKAILTAYPGAKLEEAEDHNIFSATGRLSATVGGELVLKADTAYPIATYATLDRDPMEGLMTTLSALAKTDGAAVQIMLRPASPGWVRQATKLTTKLRRGRQQNLAFGVSDLAKAAVKAPTAAVPHDLPKGATNPNLSQLELSAIEQIEEKTKHPGFEVLVRILVSAESGTRSQQVLQDMATSFALFERPGLNGFKFMPAQDVQGLVTAFIFRFFPPEMHSSVLNSAELATLFHLPDSQFMPSSNIKRQMSKEVDGPATSSATGLLFGYNEFRGEKKEIRLSVEDRRRHTYILGQTGTGKSTMLENLMVQDMIAGNGFAFIDPHGGSAEKILSLVPKSRAEDVIYFDPADMEYPLGLNLFEFDDPSQKDFLIQESLGMLYKLYDKNGTGVIGPRFEQWYRNAALTLMADPNGATFIEIPKVFTDTEYLKEKFKYLKDPTVIDFWTKEMGQTSDYHKSEMLGYFVSKFGAFQQNEMMRNIIGQTKSSFNLREIMDNKKIFIVNLSKGRVGELNSQLLGMMLVIKFQAAAMSREDMAEGDRNDFSLYVDEFQNFSTDSFASILSEARKYRLNLIVGNQFIGQLSNEIRDAVFGNVGTIVAHRMGPEDAEFMVKQMAPIFDASDLMNLPNYHSAVRLMIGGLPSQPFTMADLPPVAATNLELGAAIKQLSAAKFGMAKTVVDADIEARLSGRPIVPAASVQLSPDAPKDVPALDRPLAEEPKLPEPEKPEVPAPAPAPAPKPAPEPVPEPKPEAAPLPEPPKPEPLPEPAPVPPAPAPVLATAPEPAPAPTPEPATTEMTQPAPIIAPEPEDDAPDPVRVAMGQPIPAESTPPPAPVVVMPEPTPTPPPAVSTPPAEPAPLAAAQPEMPSPAVMATPPPPIGAPPIGAPPVDLPLPAAPPVPAQATPDTLSIADITGGRREPVTPPAPVAPREAGMPAMAAPDVQLIPDGAEPPMPAVEPVAMPEALPADVPVLVYDPANDPNANVPLLASPPPASSLNPAPVADVVAIATDQTPVKPPYDPSVDPNAMVPLVMADVIAAKPAMPAAQPKITITEPPHHAAVPMTPQRAPESVIEAPPLPVTEHVTLPVQPVAPVYVPPPTRPEIHWAEPSAADQAAVSKPVSEPLPPMPMPVPAAPAAAVAPAPAPAPVVVSPAPTPTVSEEAVHEDSLIHFIDPSLEAVLDRPDDALQITAPAPMPAAATPAPLPPAAPAVVATTPPPIGAPPVGLDAPVQTPPVQPAPAPIAPAQPSQPPVAATILAPAGQAAAVVGPVATLAQTPPAIGAPPVQLGTPAPAEPKLSEAKPVAQAPVPVTETPAPVPQPQVAPVEPKPEPAPLPEPPKPQPTAAKADTPSPTSPESKPTAEPKPDTAAATQPEPPALPKPESATVPAPEPAKPEAKEEPALAAKSEPAKLEAKPEPAPAPSDETASKTPPKRYPYRPRTEAAPAAPAPKPAPAVLPPADAAPKATPVTPVSPDVKPEDAPDKPESATLPAEVAAAVAEVTAAEPAPKAAEPKVAEVAPAASVEASKAELAAAVAEASSVKANPPAPNPPKPVPEPVVAPEDTKVDAPAASESKPEPEPEPEPEPTPSPAPAKTAAETSEKPATTPERTTKAKTEPPVAAPKDEPAPAEPKLESEPVPAATGAVVQPTKPAKPAEVVAKTEAAIDELLSGSLIHLDTNRPRLEDPEEAAVEADSKSAESAGGGASGDSGRHWVGSALPMDGANDDDDEGPTVGEAPSVDGEHYAAASHKVIQPLGPIVPLKEQLAKELVAEAQKELAKPVGPKPATPVVAPAAPVKAPAPAVPVPPPPATPVAAPVPAAMVATSPTPVAEDDYELPMAESLAATDVAAARQAAAAREAADAERAAAVAASLAAQTPKPAEPEKPEEPAKPVVKARHRTERKRTTPTKPAAAPPPKAPEPKAPESLAGKMILPTAQKPDMPTPALEPAKRPEKLAKGEIYVDADGNVTVGE